MDTLIVVGGGLIGALVALANRLHAGQRRIVLVEDRHRFGGGPVQPFFGDTIGKDGMELIADAIIIEWPGYLVNERAAASPDEPILTRIDRPICVVAPEQLHADLVTLLPPEDLHLHADIGPLSVGRTSVDLGALTLEGDAVLDLRPARRISSSARIEIEIGSHLPEEFVELSLPVLADGSVPGAHLMQYFPMDPRWLVMRRVRYLSDADPGTPRHAHGPAGGADAVRHLAFMFDAPALPIPFPVPSALLPSEVPGATALALAVAACPAVTPTAIADLLATLAASHRREGAGRLQALDLLAQAGPDSTPFAAIELANRL